AAAAAAGGSEASGSSGYRLLRPRHFPPPAALRADVAVTGATSCLAAPIDVAATEAPPPDTLSCGDFVRATPGFSWLCSRHWALKTDLAPGSAASILELLELAWPHYAAVFGAEPPPQRRLAIVAASSRNALKRAMLDDAMFSFSLGGVTQEGYGCSYLYAGTPYQTRYIALHEATHLFQYCLSGNTRGAYGFFVEGVADYLSSHVYDPATHTLAVNVLDRAPIHNHLADGLREWRASGTPPFSTLYANPEPSRGLSVLMTAFLQSTPDFVERWREYCHAMALRNCIGGNGSKVFSDTLIDRLYGGAAALDGPFRDWMEALSPSYSLLRREFDQEGGAFVSCFPASPAAPALLEWRATIENGGNGGHLPFSATVRWREPPRRGAFATIELAQPEIADGGVVTCTITNALRGDAAFFEVNGVRAQSLGGRHLHSLLSGGVDIRLAANGVATLSAGGETLAAIPVAACPMPDDGSFAIWRISASQPGVVFDMGDPRLPASTTASTTASTPTSTRTRTLTSTNPAPATPLSFKVLGPFAQTGGNAAPRLPPPGGSPIDLSAVHTLDDGTFVLWRDAATRRNAAFSPYPIANLAATFGRQADGASAYALAAIDSPDGGDVAFTLGVSDGVEAFVNGARVFSDLRHREWQDGNVTFRATLRPGRNELLLRLVHGTGVWLLSGAEIKRP
ncbi:MAG: hypothetical protein IJP66_03555, partial [Kiritimatiellae bacterium]|nr:hypothetical protein [Kiritimatiellia bacterium]